jgi:microcystin-dependent protein
MPSYFSPSLRLELIGAGEQAGVWGETTNNNLGELLEQAIAGQTVLDVTLGNITLSSLNGVVDEARSAVLVVTGTPGVTRVLTIPNEPKLYTVINQTTNIVQVKTTSGTAFDCPPSATSIIACNGNDAVQGSGVAPLASPAFTGVPAAPTALSGTATPQIATTAFVATAVSNAIPAGIISMWSGSIGAIPAGWALCDGTGGRPDLRDRFIVGAGSAYAIGNTGGFNTVTLTTAQIPSHSHNGSGTTGNQNANHTHSISVDFKDTNHTHNVAGGTSIQDRSHGHSGATDAQGNHAHGYSFSLFGNGNDETQSFPSASDNFNPGRTFSSTTADAGTHNHNVSTGIQNSDHAHTFNVNSGFMSANQSHNHTAAASINSANHGHAYSFTTDGGTGGGAAHENRPPYFALAYIIKT